MVTFKGVGSFLDGHQAEVETRRVVGRFFADLRHNNIVVLNYCDQDIKDLFKQSDLSIHQQFMVHMDLQTGGKSPSMHYYMVYDEEPPGLDDLYELLEIFYNHLSREGVEMTEADWDAFQKLRGVHYLSFLVCQDHEGLIPMIALSRGIMPSVGIHILGMMMKARFLGPNKE